MVYIYNDSSNSSGIPVPFTVGWVVFVIGYVYRGGVVDLLLYISSGLLPLGAGALVYFSGGSLCNGSVCFCDLAGCGGVVVGLVVAGFN